jgi:hypothetical protein
MEIGKYYTNRKLGINGKEYLTTHIRVDRFNPIGGGYYEGFGFKGSDNHCIISDKDNVHKSNAYLYREITRDEFVNHLTYILETLRDIV